MIVALRFASDYRRSVMWWTIGIAALVAFTVAFYPTIRDQASFDEIFEQLPPAVRAFVGSEEGVSITSPPGYLQARLFGSLLPVLLLVFGVGVGARAIGGSEDDGTLELVLSNPVTRGQVAAERYVALVALVGVLVAATIVALLVLSPPFDLLEGISITNLMGAVVAAGCLALLHGSIAFAVGCAAGRRGLAVGAATTVAVAGFLAEGLFEAARIEGWLRQVSPWHWYLASDALTDEAAIASFVLPLACSAVVVVLGAAAFTRRDLH